MTDWAAIRARFRAEVSEIAGEPRPPAPPIAPPEPPGIFYMGAPCRHGHSGKRYRSTHSCVACAQAAARDYRAGCDIKLSVAEERLSILAMYYEQSFDRAGWRWAHIPGSELPWEEL